MISIYVICDGRKPGWYSYSGGYGFDYKPIYVGLTRRKVSQRVNEHFKDVDTVKGSTFRDSVQESRTVVVEVIWTGDSVREAAGEESKAIASIGRKDLKLGPLLNRHAGGQTVSFKALSSGQALRRLAEGYQKRWRDMEGIRLGLRRYWDSMPADVRSRRSFQIAQTRVNNGSEIARGKQISATKRKYAVRTYLDNLQGFDHFWVAPFADSCAFRGSQPYAHVCAVHGRVDVCREEVMVSVRKHREPCPFCRAEVTHKKDTPLKILALSRRDQ